eukprot:gnl/MRDRNA2_/MRDRNA2_26997_c0_seq1.p1 gnl/MRDRNA2_/MRDRNA2_26997_c0~~gnl/MRDRNA2_/MRDRNA2_26997_c0_seq1.p1  ORF type:complete len:439 (-),score=91.13 gnl/MRDRNA2_/MRDRNA2_26997_c0_seq1:74-1390(-)
MSESLLEKYKDQSMGMEESILREKIMSQTPSWDKYAETKGSAHLLTNLKGNMPVPELKGIIAREPQILSACMQAMMINSDSQPLQYVLTILFDILREDSSAFKLFADALSNKIDFWKPFIALLKNRSVDPYVADKAAYLLTALMAHSPGYFQMADVDEVCSILTGVGVSKCTEIGVLDAICNLLKLDMYRLPVFSKVEVPDRIFRVKKDDPAPKVYKSIFCCWLVSFDDSLVKGLKYHNVIEHTKGILMTSRAEKVVRVCLSFLKNALSCKALCEDIVEKEILDLVQSLEYEKWRDAELYDEIREVCQKISKEVSLLSNFDRYERELQTGQLTWGFIHSDKFWSENVMKFEANQFSAVKKLAALLSSTNPTTLAVACHDLGEFVQLHPLGKMKAAELNVKDKVMELMAHVDRDVQRESLLCCQKLMLNKWQDLPSAQA